MRLSAPAYCTLYRAFTPRWAAEPLSGAGAARSGGRFNRFGQPALYLSLQLETAASEYAQAAPFLPPLTLVSYAADLPALADLRLLDASWDAVWADWADDWRKALVNKIEPVSWVLGDLLREAEIPGVIFPAWRGPKASTWCCFWTCCSPSAYSASSTMAACRAMAAVGAIRRRWCDWARVDVRAPRAARHPTSVSRTSPHVRVAITQCVARRVSRPRAAEDAVALQKHDGRNQRTR